MWHGTSEAVDAKASGTRLFLAMPLIFRNSLVVDTRREVKHMIDDLTAEGIPHRDFLVDSDTWNPDNKAIIIPEQEVSTLAITDAQKTDLLNYVNSGGTLIACGSAYTSQVPRTLDFLNDVFSFDLQLAHRTTTCSMTKTEPECEMFCTRLTTSLAKMV